MIDAGTKGKSGQTTIHIKDLTTCYECDPKPTPKVYPVCMIRSTPTKIEHCITWGKYLYEALFSPEDPSNILSEMKLSSDTTSEILFEKLFVDGLSEKAKSLEYPKSISPKEIPEGKLSDFEELVNGFVNAYSFLRYREKLSFIKTDKVAVQFIAAVSNLRALNFGITPIELMKIEEIAGNIIPAIGSTNAIAAGLQVIEAQKCLNNKTEFGTVWIYSEPSNNKLIVPELKMEPKPSVRIIQCYICSIKRCHVTVNFLSFTLQRLISDVLIKKLYFNQPSILWKNTSLYEEGSDIEEDFLNIYKNKSERTLKELTFVDGEEIICSVWFR